MIGGPVHPVPGDDAPEFMSVDRRAVVLERLRGRWTQWVDFTPEPLKLQRVKGQWQIPQDTWLLRGKLPGAEDFASAGVK